MGRVATESRSVRGHRDIKILLFVAHIAKVTGKGKSHVSKMDAILAVPKLEYAEKVWEGNKKTP